jgi:membrane protein
MLRRITFVFSEIKEVIKLTFNGWFNDNMMLHAAGLAFYTIFSLAPLIILIIALAGIFFGEQAASGQLSQYMVEMLGADLADSVEAIVVSVYQSRTGIAATVAGSAILVFTATTVITQLKESLNTIWGVETPKGKSIALFFINRALAIVLIIIFSFTLAATIILDYLLGLLDPLVGDYIPPALVFFGLINNILFLLVTTILFAIIYKMLPDVKVKWSDVFVGAFVTALLFLFGHYMVGYYLSNAATVSAFGAAGSFVVFLMWVYYNMLVIFFGAEFTSVYTMRYGSQVEPGVFVSWAERSLLKNKRKKSSKKATE